MSLYPTQFKNKFQITDPTNSTDASGATGSFATLGGVSIAQDVYVGGNVTVGGIINQPTDAVTAVTINYSNVLPGPSDTTIGLIPNTNVAGSFMIFVNNQLTSGATAILFASRSTTTVAGNVGKLSSASFNDVTNSYVADLNIIWQASTGIQLYYTNTGSALVTTTYNVRVLQA
jgi:hypothetical protein